VRPSIARRRAAEAAWARRARFVASLTPLDAAVQRAKDSPVPLVFADVADNPGGGGSGKTMWLRAPLQPVTLSHTTAISVHLFAGAYPRASGPLCIYTSRRGGLNRSTQNDTGRVKASDAPCGRRAPIDARFNLPQRRGAACYPASVTVRLTGRRALS